MFIFIHIKFTSNKEIITSELNMYTVNILLLDPTLSHT